jgi:hypothetical protein
MSEAFFEYRIIENGKLVSQSIQAYLVHTPNQIDGDSYP